MADEKLVFNGINANTGGYLIPPTDLETLAKVAAGEELDPDELAELKAKVDAASTAHFGVVEGVDPKKLEETGWGIIFPFAKPGTDAHAEQAAIREALAPLMAWRKEQAARKDERFFKDYVGRDAYRPGESKPRFLARHGAGPGPADPKKVPYYLLIVGSPEQIPYRVQYQIDVQYAVGRVHFDSVEDYAHYAASVVAAEKEGLKLARRATFFGVANEDDRATQASARFLVDPLADWMTEDQAGNGWSVERHMREAATKARLEQVLRGDGDRPALLFSASHGMGFDKGDALQLRHQGALLCQDWQGPMGPSGPIGPDKYFSGDDLGADARLHGLLAFFFACYGGGSPHFDEFAKQAYKDKRAEIAPHPFVAGLPKRMLAHAKGGALAVAGHVDRAWGTSFLWAGTRDDTGSPAQRAVFESSLKRLAEGHPMGSAFDYFNERYAELSSDLSIKLEDIEFGAEVPPRELASMWTANNDARGYTIVGDPAVRMCVAPADGSAVKERVSIEVATPRPAEAAPAPDGGAAEAASGGAAFAAAPAGDEGAPEAAFGLLGSGGNEKSPGLRARIVDTVSRAVQEAATLEVCTYTTADMSAARAAAREGKLAETGELRALTRLSVGGKMEVCIPDDEELDPKVLQMHEAMVGQARQHRAELLRAALELIPGSAEK